MKFEDIHTLMQKPDVKPDTYEAGMALNQLLKIGTHAIKIHNMIKDDQEMEAWVAKKIDLASNYVKSVHGYTAGEKVGTYDDAGMTEDGETHPLWGDWGTTPQEWSDTHVANNDDMVMAIAKGEIPPKPVTLSSYFDEQNDLWPEGVEGGKYNDEQIIDIISDTVGYDCRSLGYDYLVKIRDGEVKGMYKPTPEQIKTAQEIIKNPEFAKARARNSRPIESVSEDAGEGHMSKSQLYQTAKMAIELLDMINKGDDLEGWVQTKLNLAADYLQAVYHYEDYQKLNPYREELDSNILHRHAGIIQKHLDEILERKCRAEDVDTKPGMMRILKKRVNEVEKEMAKKMRENVSKKDVDTFHKKLDKLVHKSFGHSSDEKEMKKEDIVNEDPRAVGRALANLKYAKAMANGIMKGDDMVLLRPKAQAFLGSADETIELLDKMYAGPTNEDAYLEEGIKEWAQRLAMAGVIVAGLAGIGSINDAIDNSIPAIKAMNTALEMAEKSGNDDLAKMIEKDISAAKVRLDSGKDLSYVKDLQDKYAKFMTTEGLNFESRLAVRLEQRIK